MRMSKVIGSVSGCRKRASAAERSSALLAGALLFSATGANASHRWRWAYERTTIGGRQSDTVDAMGEGSGSSTIWIGTITITATSTQVPVMRGVTIGTGGTGVRGIQTPGCGCTTVTVVILVTTTTPVRRCLTLGATSVGGDSSSATIPIVIAGVGGGSVGRPVRRVTTSGT